MGNERYAEESWWMKTITSTLTITGFKIQNSKNKIMKFTGKITRVMDVQTGTSEKGNEWKKQTIVVTDDDPNVAYPDEVVLDLWNDRIPEQPLEVGQHVEVFFSVRTRSYNEKLFNDYNVFRIK